MLLVIGALPILLVAGLIEGFISPAEVIPNWFKYGFGLLTGIALHLFLLVGLGDGTKPQRDKAIYSQLETLVEPVVNTADF